jgi:mannose-6-phosphate isomerase
MNEIRVDKPWGWELIREQNENYVVKILHMYQNHKCSLQFHEKKHETFYVLNGTIKFVVGKNIDELNEIILTEGQSYTIEPNVIHRMEAIVDSTYLECSTNFLDDVIRIEDEYGRI